MKRAIVLLAFLVPCLSALRAQIQLDSTVVTPVGVATNLQVPWEILWGPDDRIWVTERNSGRIRRVDPATGVFDTLVRVPDVFQTSESGLLGMVLHPNFSHPDSSFVYIVYTYWTGSKLFEKLVRYIFSVDTLVSPLILLDSIPANSNHDGSRLVILPDRTLLMTTGDAQNTALPQNMSSPAGKVLRLNLDGTVPADNPMPGSYVWSWGHRNAQGLVRAPDGRIYSSEHGPNNDDELNLLEVNRNFGWPDVHGFCDPGPEATYCAANNVVEPLMAWTPTLATAGIDYYNHPAIPEWSHAVLLVTLKEDDFRVLKLNTAGDSIVSESIYLNNSYGRLRDICVSPAGDIYIATSNRDGRANDGFPVTADDRIIKLTNLDYVPVGSDDGQGYLRRVKIHPNPLRNIMTIVLESEPGKDALFVATDVGGREVLRVSLTGRQTETGPVNMSAGMYLYRVIAGGIVEDAGRFVVVR